MTPALPICPFGTNRTCARGKYASGASEQSPASTEIASSGFAFLAMTLNYFIFHSAMFQVTRSLTDDCTPSMRVE
jgi:hypothetical protein